MKKLILASVLALSMSTAQAISFSELSGMFKETVEPAAEYAVATSGNNVRVYEWQTPTGKYCILATTSKSAVMQCF